MPHAISLSVEGKHVMLMFEDLDIAIKITEILEKSLNLQPVEGESNIFEEEAQQLATYLLAQPLYSDIQITQPDYRVNLPTHLLCRSLIATEQVPIQEFHSLSKEIREPMPFAPPIEPVEPLISVPSYLPPTIPATYQQPPPPEPSYQNVQIPHQEEQLYKPIQTLFLLCEKNEYYMRDLANFTKIPFSNDKEIQIKICSYGASKMFELPISDRISMVKRMPFEGELKEKVIEILYKQKSDLERKDRDKDREPYDRHKRLQPPILQENQLPDSEKIKQVMSVLKQLQPEAISKLLHGQQPQEIAMCKQQGYKMTFKPGYRVIINDDKSFEVAFNEYNQEMAKIKGELYHVIPESEEIEQQVRELFVKYNERHNAIFAESEMCKFHASFNEQENLLILLRVRSQLQRRFPEFSMKRLADEAQERLSIGIFEKLKIIVEQHRNVQSNEGQMHHEQHPGAQTTPAAPAAPEAAAPVVRAPPPPSPPPQQAVKPVDEKKVSNIEESIKQIPLPVQQKEKIKQSKSIPALSTENLTPQHQQILQDVQKAQDALKQPDIADVQEMAKGFKASVISKIFVTILGLGYQYHHLYLLEQNLLDKQIETLREQLNLDINTEEMGEITDVLLKSLITFIIKEEEEQILQPFTSKQKPQMVKIAPQLQALHEVKDFFFKYQEVCSDLRGEKDAGKHFGQLNETSQFIVFEREDLVEMFQGVNVFGDLLDAICIGDK